MRFYKYEALGNDYVLLDNREGRIPEQQKLGLAKKLCDRRHGIGSDGLLLVEGDGTRMRMFNPDGSEAEMCGNGIRCFVRYLHDHVEERGVEERGEYTIQTAAGSQRVGVDGGSITVAMPEPVDGGEVELEVLGNALIFKRVSVGNPHAVIFKAFENWRELGEIVENDPNFPDRTNVEFVEIADMNSCRISVWERGAGPTPACGTGAVASCFAGVSDGRLERDTWIRAEMPGGALEVSIGKDALIRGPATEVFSGEKTI